MRRYLWFCSSVALSVFLTACAGEDSAVQPQSLAAGLPPISSLHQVSSVVDHYQDGAAPALSSAGFIAEGSSGRLNADDGGEYEWAIYSFDPGDEPLIEAMVHVTAFKPGSQLYVGCSNFDAGVWDLSGPFSTDPPFSNTLPLDNSTHLSPGHAVYFAVLAPLGSNFAYDQVSFRTEGNLPPVAIIDADVLAGDPPLDVLFSGAQSYDPDGQIVNYYWDLNGDGLLETDTGSDPSAGWSYNSTGYYLARLRVTDNEGLSASSEPLGITVHGGIVRNVSSTANPAYSISMAQVDGHPVISYVESDALHYCESDTALGTGVGDWHMETLQTPYYVEVSLSRIADINSRPGVIAYSYNANNDDVLLYAYSESGDALDTQNWSFMDVDVLSTNGYSGSLALVDGNPAVIYDDYFDGLICYSRSKSASGMMLDDWDRLELDQDNYLNFETPGLSIVDGNPAFVYQLGPGERLGYMRSDTAHGLALSDWQKVELVNTYSVSDACLSIIDGHPAVAYKADTIHDQRYLWCSTAQGLAQGDWLDVEVESFGTLGKGCKLVEAQGVPCIAYNRSDSSNIHLARSSSVHGTAGADWSNIVNASGLDNPSEDFGFASIQGFPAIAYYDPGSGYVKYVVIF